MSKTRSVLLLVLYTALTISIHAQGSTYVTVKVVLIDKDLNLKPVPKLALVVRKAETPAESEVRISTSLEGTASLALPAGRYVLCSVTPVDLGGRSFSWEFPFEVTTGGSAAIELSNDNAKITFSSTDQRSSGSQRRVSIEGDLFKTLRNGVVTVEGELGSGTGFIIDEKGLVLTNHHVIAKTNEIRVRFDKYTAVRARLLARDAERDVAVLQINPTAFPKSQALKLASSSADAHPILVGEHVFTILSPLHQEKLLTSGIVSGVDARAIISDIKLSANGSGAPLFNSVGEVVGITTVLVKEKEKGGDTTVVVRMNEVASLLEQARGLAASKGLPSAELMPSPPEGTFPVETIKAALSRKDFPIKEYISDVKDYEIKFMTPVYKFYEIHRDKMESLKNREKRNSKKGVVDAVDKFGDLSYWSEYAGELRPVVDLLALPETTATGKSMFLSIASSATTGYAIPLDHKYKADFYQMKLLCDGQVVTPISRNKIEISRDLQHYYKTRKRFTYAGVYSYPFDVFAPNRCRDLQVQVFSEEDIETPITTIVNATTKSRVWTDFDDFRRLAAVKP